MICGWPRWENLGTNLQNSLIDTLFSLKNRQSFVSNHVNIKRVWLRVYKLVLKSRPVQTIALKFLLNSLLSCWISSMVLFAHICPSRKQIVTEGNFTDSSCSIEEVLVCLLLSLKTDSITMKPSKPIKIKITSFLTTLIVHLGLTKCTQKYLLEIWTSSWSVLTEIASKKSIG